MSSNSTEDRPICKMIIDTDPGIDDAMAIVYAAVAPEIELLGLTSVFGNVTTEIATRNALRLVEMLDLDIPVAEGAQKPQALPPIEPSSWVHGVEGFGNVPASTPAGRPIDESAAEYLVRMAREMKGELTVCPVGPLTNIADAIRLDPEFTSNCKQVVIMGGSARAGGNITAHAEANTYHDAHAAADVFAAGGNIVMVGLDVTNQILCNRADFRELEAASPKFGGFLKDAADFYLDFYLKEMGFDGCGLHDPAAVIACTHPDLFTMETAPVRVVTEGEAMGQTIEDTTYNAPAINICIDVDVLGVKQRWMDGIKTLD